MAKGDGSKAAAAAAGDDGAVAQIEEQEAFIDRIRTTETRSRARRCCDFVYNRETGRVLGRTGLSWLELTIFYIIFYSCLVAFWAICLFVFIQTLDDKHPRYYGKGTIIGVNPGMGYQPWRKDDPDSTLIRYSKSDPDSYEVYVKALNDYTDRYGNVNGTRECGDDESNSVANETESCRVELPTSGGCTRENDWGYPDGKPCVLLTLNRLIDWTPAIYPEDSIPEAIRERYEPGDIAVGCEGEYFSDDESLGPIDYYPESGMQGKYFPYRVMDNYHQPYVRGSSLGAREWHAAVVQALVQFTHPQLAHAIQVICKAYASNIEHDLQNKMGMIGFELLIDS